jgi:hypothetical protein
MSSGLVYFKNGQQLDIGKGPAESLQNLLRGYLSHPAGASRIAEVTYSVSGGMNNAKLSVDLEAVQAVLAVAS